MAATRRPARISAFAEHAQETVVESEATLPKNSSSGGHVCCGAHQQLVARDRKSSQSPGRMSERSDVAVCACVFFFKAGTFPFSGRDGIYHPQHGNLLLLSARSIPDPTKDEAALRVKRPTADIMFHCTKLRVRVCAGGSRERNVVCGGGSERRYWLFSLIRPVHQFDARLDFKYSVKRCRPPVFYTWSQIMTTKVEIVMCIRFPKTEVWTHKRS